MKTTKKRVRRARRLDKPSSLESTLRLESDLEHLGPALAMLGWTRADVNRLRNEIRALLGRPA